METTAALITAIVGILVSIFASLLTKFASEKSPFGKSKIKIGGVEIQLSESADESTKKILDRVQELQESPQVFLSYSVKDKEFAQRLTNNLRKEGIKVWLADEQVKVGDRIVDTIRNGISSSQWVIVILSENSSQSNFIEKELSFALQEEQNRNRPFILPVLIGNTELPMQLQDKQYADFRDDYSYGFKKLLYRLKPSSEVSKTQHLETNQSRVWTEHLKDSDNLQELREFIRSEIHPVIAAMEMGEISRDRIIESQQWHSWNKWIYGNDVGYFELKALKENGELVPALKTAIQAEIEKLQKKQVENKLPDNEMDYIQLLRELVDDKTG